VLPVPGKLCRADYRFLRRLCGGLGRQLHQQRPLRAQYPDTDPDDHANADADNHADADQHADTVGDTDTDRNRHKHARSERLLSVCGLLRGTNRRHMRRVSRGIWGDMRRRGGVHRSNANADVYGNPHPDTDGDTNGYADTDLQSDSNQYPDSNTHCDIDCYTHLYADCVDDDGFHADRDRDEHGYVDTPRHSNGDPDADGDTDTDKHAPRLWRHRRTAVSSGRGLRPARSDVRDRRPRRRVREAARRLHHLVRPGVRL